MFAWETLLKYLIRVQPNSDDDTLNGEKAEKLQIDAPLRLWQSAAEIYRGLTTETNCLRWLG